MLIKIDDTYHKLHAENSTFWVDIPECKAYQSSSLGELILRLKFDFDNVSLPETIFTDDLLKIEDLLKLGFKYLEEKEIILYNQKATLRPMGYWSSKARTAPPEADPRQFRLYQATWTDEEGKNWAQIFTEDELDYNQNT